ncbi:MAG TPA: hypothetical protein PLZ15_02315 [Melioribacteraceae bacterium]|nr:hypothetical protein [Melioribacteraceae bacterium]
MRNYALIISLLFITGISELTAQDETSANFYINGGVGVSSMNLGMNAGVNLRVDNVVATIRAAGAATGVFGSAIEEFGFLLGYIEKAGDIHFTVSGGLGESKYDESKGLFTKSVISKSIGLAFEGRLCYSFWSFIGIGVALYGNLNEAKSFIGINLNLFIGSLDL